jgi:hypothetical protein
MKKRGKRKKSEKKTYHESDGKGVAAAANVIGGVLSIEVLESQHQQW